MERGSRKVFVPRFEARFDGKKVQVDNRLLLRGGNGDGQIKVAVRNSPAKRHFYVDLNNLSGVPPGFLAVTRQLFNKIIANGSR